MAARIFACRGTVKKYIGNAIFARECREHAGKVQRSMRKQAKPNSDARAPRLRSVEP